MLFAKPWDKYLQIILNLQIDSLPPLLNHYPSAASRTRQLYSFLKGKFVYSLVCHACKDNTNSVTLLAFVGANCVCLSCFINAVDYAGHSRMHEVRVTTPADDIYPGGIRTVVVYAWVLLIQTIIIWNWCNLKLELIMFRC